MGTRCALVRAKVTSHSLPAGLEADEGGAIGLTTGDYEPGPPSPLRRGQRHFVIVGEKSDGEPVEARLSPTAIFKMRGL